MAYATSLAGSKLRAKLGASLNEQVSAPTSDFAQRQLKLMGWTEGEGLGKKRQGRSTHIKVKRREDNMGLGHGQQQAENIAKEASWWKDSMGDTLAKLSKDKKKKKKSKKRHYTDEELFEATGGARFGMRAQRRATAKWARTESSITDQDEEEARERLEWNGRGVAQTVLTSSDQAGESEPADSNTSSSGEEAFVEIGTKSNKKKKRSSDKKKNKRKKASGKEE